MKLRNCTIDERALNDYIAEKFVSFIATSRLATLSLRWSFSSLYVNNHTWSHLCIVCCIFFTFLLPLLEFLALMIFTLLFVSRLGPRERNEREKLAVQCWSRSQILADPVEDSHSDGLQEHCSTTSLTLLNARLIFTFYSDWKLCSLLERNVLLKRFIVETL